ncbi:MAG TPA: sialidase family protein, partial [Acidimicrobiales bacterium]|nr:sialidase family protein [Acidimicrobiales bacterium]
MKRRLFVTAGIVAVAATSAVPAWAGPSTGPTYTKPVVLSDGLGGGEPSIAIDQKAPQHVYVSAPQSIPAAGNALLGGTNTNGVGFWSSSDGGQTFAKGINVGSTTGGGDSDVAVGSDGSVYVADLEAVAADICKSTDHGKTFTSGNALSPADSCTTITTNQNGPEDDRPWLSTTSDGNVYLTYHDFAGGMPIVERSTDGGSTFAPCGAIFDPAGPAAANYNPAQGTIVAKPAIGADNSMYVEVTEPVNTSQTPVGAPLSNLYMAVAQGGCSGSTVFKNYTIFDGSAAGANLGKIFNAVTVDAGGYLYAVAAGTLTSSQTDNNVYLFVSKDHGATWSKPITVNRPDTKANVMPALVGGLQAGQVAIGWFGCTANGDPNQCTKWDYYATQSTDAGQTFTTPVDLTGDIHNANICTVGVYCGTPADGNNGNGNRNLADFAS